MTLNRWRILLIAVFVVLAGVYSIVTPIFEASDELWHYPMVKYVADHGFGLPVQTPGEVTAWRQEGSQPPLYYLMAAALTGGIDSSNLATIRRQNPHADIGIVVPDGNLNMVVHHRMMEDFPWTGTVLAVHLARFLSVLLGAGTVAVTFSLARRLFPKRPEVIVGATALNAFLPMFLFISGSVNNDNLSNLLGNLLTLEVVMLLTTDRQPTWRMYTILGITAGAGLLAKFNIGFMLPLVALALIVLSLRFRSLKPVILGGMISGGLTVALAGWWYWRNWQLYGDPTGLNVFLDIVGRRGIPANAAQLWAERYSFLDAFWGFFGGVNLPLSENLYAIFNAVGLIGSVGSVTFVLSCFAKERISRRTVEQAFPYAVTLLWIAINFVSYLRWTSETPASQGRLMFGALSSILIWLAVGLTWWMPRRARQTVMSVIALFFGIAALAIPFTVIQPAYASPESVTSNPTEVLAVFRAPDGGSIALAGAQVETPSAQPDDYIHVNLTWRIELPFTRDWSLFLHLVTPDNVIIGQRDIYPGAGKLALSDIAANQTWNERLAVRVPANAYAPQTVRLELGWYDLGTLERLQKAPAEGDRTTTIIGETQILPRASTLAVPNPTSINFGGLIELVGYAMSDLSPNAGSPVDLTLYWRALQPIPQDYVVFAHILDPATTTIYAGSDAQPADWTRPTSTWQIGEIVEDNHILTLDPDTPVAPGIYEVEIGLYLNPGDGTFPRLRVVTPDGGMADDHAYLSRVRVLPREETQ